MNLSPVCPCADRHAPVIFNIDANRALLLAVGVLPVKVDAVQPVLLDEKEERARQLARQRLVLGDGREPAGALVAPYADHELAVVLHRRGLDCVEVRVREPVGCGQLGVLGDLHAEQDQVRDVRARGVPVRARAPLGQVPGDDERIGVGAPPSSPEPDAATVAAAMGARATILHARGCARRYRVITSRGCTQRRGLCRPAAGLMVKGIDMNTSSAALGSISSRRPCAYFPLRIRNLSPKYKYKMHENVHVYLVGA